MAITFALKLAEADTSPSSPNYVTASWTPTAGKVYCCFILQSTLATVDTPPTGNGLTWLNGTSQNRSGNCTEYSFYAVADGGASAGSMTITITGSPTGIIVHIIEVGGDIDTASPVVQSPGNNGSGTTSTLTLAAFSDAVNNGLLFSAGITLQTAISSADGTSLSDIGHATPVREQAVFWHIGEDLGPQCTFSSTGWCTLGFELRYKSPVVAADQFAVPAIQGHAYF